MAGPPHGNIFRILADLSHMAAICILIFSIHRNRSAEGVSLITQIFYAVVFCTRYLDILRTENKWNLFFKIFFTLLTLYTIFIMRALFPRTREREVAWKLGAVIMGGSIVLTPLMMLVFEYKYTWYFTTWTYIFSQILESVCVLPQLLLLRQTTVPTVISSFYILFLGSYRGLYILNWIWRGIDSNDRSPNAVSVIFGIIQTAFYVDFAWVYWTRQRVKLRDGAVVDADDLRRGWLLQRVFGKHIDAVAPEDEENRAGLGVGGNNNRRATGGGARSKWGARGISVSADDGVLNDEEHHGMLDESDDEEHGVTGMDPDAKIQDPDELVKALEEDEDDDVQPRAGSSGQVAGVRGGDEWDD